MIHRIIKHFPPLISTILSELCKGITVSFIVGSKAAFFSLAQSAFPLIGFFGGIRSTSIIFGIRLIIMSFVKGMGTYLYSAYHIPTFCGALYLATPSKLIRIAIPAFCMALFVAHPIGRQAFVYTLYWLIPMVIAYIPSRSILLQALGSTFTTHAVGSIIHLYLYPSNPAIWNTLVSIVWIERLILASGMTALYYGISFIHQQLSSRQALRQLHNLVVNY
jgi:hypothetical protein